MRLRRRPAYTLLEVVLALLIGVLLLAALYGAVSYHLRQAQAGRDTVQQTTLVRAIVSRIENDAVATVALGDPNRFRSGQSQLPSAVSDSSGGTAARGSSTSGPTGSSTPMPSTPATGTPSTTTPSTGASGAGGSGSQPAQASTSPPVLLPLGVVGDSTSLMLFVSKVPSEAWPGKEAPGQLVSDLRRICYWVDGDKGLCRQELRLVTSPDALDTTLPPSGGTAVTPLAREVKSIEFTYFDGKSWQDSWDSNEVGDDGSTPIGSPRAIAVRLGIQPRRGVNDTTGPPLKYYRHVIPIQTANGVTQENNDTTTGGGSSP